MVIHTPMYHKASQCSLDVYQNTDMCMEVLHHRKGTPKLGDLKIIWGRCISTFPLFLTERQNFMPNVNKSSQGEEKNILYCKQISLDDRGNLSLDFITLRI